MWCVDMTNKTLEIGTKLLYRTILTRIIAVNMGDLPEGDLSIPQRQCLCHAHMHNEPSVGEIAQGLEISNVAAAKLIDRLVKKNLLFREEGKKDRRVIKIKLTAQGKYWIEHYKARQTQIFEGIIARMPPEAVLDLQNGLMEFFRAAFETPEQLEKICLRCGLEHIQDCPGNLRYRELTGHDKEKN